MPRLKVFIITLFFASLAIAFTTGPIIVETKVYIKALLLFWFFSLLYSHLSIEVKKGKITMDYGVNYGLAIALFAGPLGVLIFESVNRFMVYFNRKRSKTADPEELLHTFYNMSAFTLNYSIAYLIFDQLYPFFQQIPFGFWLLITILITTAALLSDLYLSVILYITGEIKTRKEVIDFIRSRSALDRGKTAISNGFLFLFLEEQRWEMLVGLFVLNYLVSRSYVAKSQSMQHKVERDKFEQMAYTDFLTEVYNRTFMDKKMNELNDSGEHLAIIVTDIDTFKQINDNYNHAVGDHVIQHFAASLQGYLQDGDYLFRSGGDEFTICLRNRDYIDCATLLNKMQQGIGNNPTTTEYQSKNVTITYSASFGMYFYLANGALEIKKAYVYADELLMEAKELGKNRISAINGLSEAPLHMEVNS